MSTSPEFVPTASHASLPPEFGDHRRCCAMFHISRSTLYALAAEGKIRSVSLCKNGKTRGRRLYDCASIRAYLHSIA